MVGVVVWVVIGPRGSGRSIGSGRGSGMSRVVGVVVGVAVGVVVGVFLAIWPTWGHMARERQHPGTPNECSW